LGVTGEKDFTGRGISYCATCDGDFFTGKEIIVVGGGNSALEEAVSLTQYATKVTVVHQFDHFQAYPSAVEEAKKNPKISFIMSSKITEFGGEESLKYVKIKSEIDNSEFEMQTNGAFIFVGYVPQTEKIKNIISLNNYSEILTEENLQTNIEGVFAAGDCRQKRWRQITTAVADGTIAALNSIEYLNSKKH
jgi:thioredoxin reductase (NADPH)